MRLKMNETIIPIIERLDKIESLIKKTNTTDDKLMTIKMVADEIGHASVVMTEKYAKCNLRRLQDDFPSLSDRIALRLTHQWKIHTLPTYCKASKYG